MWDSSIPTRAIWHDNFYKLRWRGPTEVSQLTGRRRAKRAARTAPLIS